MQFNDTDLCNASKLLKDRCVALGLMLANKTYPARNGGGYYEVPPEYKEDHFYEEVGAISKSAELVCVAYDELIKLSIGKGLNL
jgi:hypothetical protein